MQREADRPMEIGDKILADGLSGLVVAVPQEGKFSDEFPAEHWAYLEVGVLVLTDEIGLVHFPDPTAIELVTDSS